MVYMPEAWHCSMGPSLEDDCANASRGSKRHQHREATVPVGRLLAGQNLSVPKKPLPPVFRPAMRVAIVRWATSCRAANDEPLLERLAAGRPSLTGSTHRLVVRRGLRSQAHLLSPGL